MGLTINGRKHRVDVPADMPLLRVLRPAREERLESRVKSLVAELDLQSGLGRAIMRETRGNKAEAARRLGITRIQLYTRLRKHGLDVPAAS